jgi:cellulose synthase/poly-beta-1,6-N-acetylglucosamine synthase-like glycosyltransferase
MASQTVSTKGMKATSPPPSTASPDASVVVPVNAKGDLDNVLGLLRDLAAYAGHNSFEVVLVVNNYDTPDPPAAVERYRDFGARIIAVSNVRRPDRPGEVVPLSAKMHGVRSAMSDVVVLFDADCRVPDATSVIDWYVAQFRTGAAAAYTPVGYYDYKPLWGVRVRIGLHHTARWVKRNVLRIPTIRGSNYAVRRDVLIDLYDSGFLADDLNVGPSVKALKGRVAYSGRRRLMVRTSGRMFTGSWGRILKYIRYRAQYNFRVLPVRANAQQYTHRDRNEKADRYDYTIRPSNGP